MQGWKELDGRALQVCAACNLAWLDTTFQLAPEAGLESGSSCTLKDYLPDRQSGMCALDFIGSFVCLTWEDLSAWALGGKQLDLSLRNWKISILPRRNSVYFI